MTIDSFHCFCLISDSANIRFNMEIITSSSFILKLKYLGGRGTKLVLKFLIAIFVKIELGC